ncbi:pyridoxamine 5'-phosphate oxidase family protein [Halogeometricum borinquense]|uniref:Pyridoxamine 5'-phosphate oxidase family protein n=1 Tax=Halogeometricum borinquense TaxID=60847 RepID=A0A6C0UI51_9EURY|nr:pyridoxamine 5'-phosphate oxidase family protein [Halogeometricum borinquense]QIB75244.1 pyridoxamine 5'-phosphate oxidase family protein [Halogeometricum borinquense]QIQ75812.1 pyridoxamine 5'-phosphate oxidase family protein [Halogeometricum borinquense]
MSDQSVSMSHEEIVEFLETGGTAVIALAKGDDSYAIPVSYGFDDEEEHFYLRLAFDSESEKREYVDAAGVDSLVIHEQTDEGWKSVVARGHLAEVTEAALDSTIVEAMRTMDIPFVTIFEHPSTELEFEMYRLIPEELTGRKEKTMRGVE